MEQENHDNLFLPNLDLGILPLHLEIGGSKTFF